MKNSFFLLVLFVFVSGCTGYVVNENITEKPLQSPSAAQIVQEVNNTCGRLDCGNTIQVCEDGFVASCRNACSEGRCVTCTPDCTGHDKPTKSKAEAKNETQQLNNVTNETMAFNNTVNDTINKTLASNTTFENQTANVTDACEGVVCEKSRRVCPDEFIATCNNTCSDGFCSNCTPDCTGHDIMRSTTGKILFTQVLYNPPGTEADEEWLEIYNPSDSVIIDLKDWKIYDNTGSWKFPDTAFIAPRSYLIISRDEAAFRALYNCTPDISTFTRGLNNGGDQLTLKNANENDVDFVAWSGGADNAYPEWSITAEENFALKRNGFADTDSPADWFATMPRPAKCS